MKQEQMELLTNYMKANVTPIMVDFIAGKDIPNAIIIESECEKEELNGHYEGQNFVAPNWYNEIINIKGLSILVIDNIDKIAKEEQTKFVEILKYRKVSTFDLPENCVIIVTSKEINKNTINEEIYSLVAHLKG